MTDERLYNIKIMDIIIFIYYMIYTFWNKSGHFIYRYSPFTIDVNDKNALDRVDIIINNATNTFFFIGVFLYSFNIYIYLPSLGLSAFQQYLLTIMSRQAAVTCITMFLGVPIYFAYFHNDKYLKYFEKFKKMGCFLTFIYSIIGLTLIILPVILLFAAIVN